MLNILGWYLLKGWFKLYIIIMTSGDVGALLFHFFLNEKSHKFVQLSKLNEGTTITSFVRVAMER